MEQFEYLVMPLVKLNATPDQRELNRLGAEGWELVGMGNSPTLTGNGTVFLVFKRKKPQ